MKSKTPPSSTDESQKQQQPRTTASKRYFNSTEQDSTNNNDNSDVFVEQQATKEIHMDDVPIFLEVRCITAVKYEAQTDRVYLM